MKALILSIFLSLGMCCTPPEGWEKKTLQKLIPEFDLMVIGKDLKHYNRTDGIVFKREFQILCILKGDNKPIQDRITLPDNPQGACAQIITEEGQTYIMGIGRFNDTSYIWSKDHATLEQVSFDYKQNKNKLCGLTETKLPESQITAQQTECPQLTDKMKMACGQAGLRQVKVFMVWTISLALSCWFFKS